MKSTNILLIEDNPGDVFLINSYLTQGDVDQFNLTHAESLASAKACLKREHFDLALLDLSLPDSHGIDTLLSLQTQAPQLPTIVLTGLDDAVLGSQLIRNGAQDYLVKGKISGTWLKSTIDHSITRSQEFEGRYQNEKQSNQKLMGRVKQYRDELVRLDERVKHLETLSLTDGLTEIANRHCFETTLAREWLQACRDQRSLSLVLIDIDYFKQFNDSCGHPQGDVCLRRVARALKRSLKRPRDLVARYGGEEFVVILPDTPKPGAINVASQLGLELRALAIRHPRSSISSWVTASFGVASMKPTTKASSSDLIEAADRALYLAKESGRDRIAYMQPPYGVTQTIS